MIDIGNREECFNQGKLNFQSEHNNNPGKD
jgi:hypothetical protein